MEQYLAFAHAHPFLVAALAVSALAIIVNELHASFTAGRLLSTPEAVRLINDQDARVIDVRSAADFKKAHVLGATHLPHDKLKARVSELERDKSKPVIVYCALGGAASRESAQWLREQGYASSFPLRGGLNAWLAASLPVTTR